MARDLTPEQMSLRGRIGAYESWAKTADRSARTAPARRSFLERFENEIDPDGKLDSAERRRRALDLRKAHMLRMAAKSAEVRSARARKSA